MEKIEALEGKLEGFLNSFEEKLKTERETNESLTDKKIDELKAELKKQTDDYLEAVRKNNVSMPGTEKGTNEFEKFNFAKCAEAIIKGDWSDAGFEKEVCDETNKKALGTQSGNLGGYLIPVELAKDKIIMPAIAKQVLTALGMQTWNGLTADLDIPEVENRPVLEWIEEGSSLSNQLKPTVGIKSLRPKEGGMLVQVSNRLFMQSPDVANQLITQMMQEGARDGLDKIGIIGTGSNSQPTGIINVSGTNTKSIDARATVDDIAAMIADVEDDNFEPTGLLSKPRVISGLKRERVAQFSGDSSGQPLIQPLMTNPMLESVLGLKIKSTTNVPISTGTETYAIVGDWTKFAMGIWGGMRLKSSDQAGTAFVSNQTWLVMFVDVDTVCLHPQAFSISSDVEGSEGSW